MISTTEQFATAEHTYRREQARRFFVARPKHRVRRRGRPLTNPQTRQRFGVDITAHA